MKKTERYQKIIKFFNCQDGDRELCEMLQIMSGDGPTYMQEGLTPSRVFHI
jgi:hypothetical protein